jgi:hypothetical protein
VQVCALSERTGVVPLRELAGAGVPGRGNGPDVLRWRRSELEGSLEVESPSGIATGLLNDELRDGMRRRDADGSSLGAIGSRRVDTEGPVPDRAGGRGKGTDKCVVLEAAEGG